MIRESSAPVMSPEMNKELLRGRIQQGAYCPASRMQLDPFLAAKLHLIDGLRLEDRTDPDALQRIIEFERDPDDWAIPHVTVRDRSVFGRHGDIPVRIYEPRTAGGALLTTARRVRQTTAHRS